MSTERYLLYFTDVPQPVPITLGWMGELDGEPIVKEPEEDFVELLDAWKAYSDPEAYPDVVADQRIHVTANGTAIDLSNLKVIVPVEPPTD